MSISVTETGGGRKAFEQDYYVPYFIVRVGGRKIPGEVVRDIMEVSYKDSVDSIDSFELTINNWDAEKRTLKYSDDEQFDPGQELEILMGYFGDTEPRKMITGLITSMRPSFPASGQPTLAVGGLSVLHQFREKQVSDTYEKLKDSQIARRIAGRLKVDLVTPSERGEAENEYVLQHNEYDIVFLLGRARRIGYELFVIEEEGKRPKLYFGLPEKSDLRPLRLTYASAYPSREKPEPGRGGDLHLLLQQFAPTLTTANQVSKVTVLGWDAVHKAEIRGEAQRSDLKTNETDGVKRARKAFDEKEEVITDRPVRTKGEATTLALETLKKIARDTVVGTGSVIGVPSLRAGTQVRLDGLGERFTGLYFVTSTTHTIGGDGYTTQFECRMEGK